MRHAFALVALLATVAIAGTAFAQSTDTARCAGASAGDDHTYCFTGEIVQGGVVGPYGQGSRVLRPMHGTSLLRIRAHFVPEMLKSVERL